MPKNVSASCKLCFCNHVLKYGLDTIKYGLVHFPPVAMIHEFCYSCLLLQLICNATLATRTALLYSVQKETIHRSHVHSLPFSIPISD